jgi:hypothetical protein
MLTKNGFVVFLRISATPTLVAVEPAGAAVVDPFEATVLLVLLEQAARASVAPTAKMATEHLKYRTRATDRSWFCMIWGLPPLALTFL